MADEMVKLEGNEHARAQGAWVREQQGVAADEGFSAVSRHWYPKTSSYDEVVERIEESRRHREDILIAIGQVDFDADDDGLVVILGDREYKCDAWSAKQLANWMTVSQTTYNDFTRPHEVNGKVHYERDQSDYELLARIFRHAQVKMYGANSDKNLRFRTYDDGSIRAVMSESYSIVDNRWYLDILNEFIPDARYSHIDKCDTDTLYCNLLIPDSLREGGDSDYGGMLSISNSEIGKRVIAQTPSLFRAICMNGCIWGQVNGVELRKRHRGIDLIALREAIRVNIDKQVPLLTTKFDEFQSLHNLKCVPAMDRIFAQIAENYTLDKTEILTVGQSWVDHSNEKTAFGVVDALTRAGQKLDSDTWVKLDIAAGSILNGGQSAWTLFNQRAAALSDKEMAKRLGTAV